MGGLKRKIDTEKKIEKKEPRAVAFSKRRKGLFRKTAELCLLSDAQIAIIATPVSSKSHNSFYSFGHPSVDSVVAAFLADEKLGFLWEEESLANSEDPEELGTAIDSMKRMLHDLKEFQDNRDHQHDDVVLMGSNQLGMMDFDPIDSEFEPQSQAAMPMIDHHVGGCSNQWQLGLDFDQDLSIQGMPMIDLDDEDYSHLLF